MSSLLCGASTTGFRSLLRREILRFVRRPRNTFLPPVITNVLYFSVFGVILGSRLSGVSGDFGYVEFVLPGLVVLGIVSNAFENASFSIFHGRWNEYIHETLTSPLSYTSMVLAYVLSSALRGLLVGALIYAVGYLFAPVVPARPFYLLAFAVVVPTLFAGLGVIGGLWARDFDYLTVLTQFILRPLVFFGGVFYSLSVLPEPFLTLSLLDPLVYMVDGVRYGVLGYAELDPNLSLAVLTAMTVAVLLLDVYLFEKGYGLVD
ncbi:ABC transporter permease [Halomarina halobia]|uniref:ABC transporter permease n=1 Tax=Halomarina halobia TaxID=3033386 RepID=A0ABD6AAN3_9EURY|nr:ABC transporter permease [Halomarina sp. PSR21]